MRAMMLILFVVVGFAAELEQITTTDGRKLVGTYDDIAGTVTLDGPGAAVIRLKPEMVKQREPFVRAEPEPKPEAQPRAFAAPAVVSKDAAMASVRLAFDKADALRHEANEIDLNAMVRYLQSSELSPIPVPDFGSDPRESEKKETKRIHEENGYRKVYSDALSRYKEAKGKEDSRTSNLSNTITRLMDLADGLRSRIKAEKKPTPAK